MMNYRTLGKTGLKVSEIGFGGEWLERHPEEESVELIKYAGKKGINIIWKSFPNTPHTVPPDSLKLARAFLAYYHELYREDLSGRNRRSGNPGFQFVGDDQESVYYTANSAGAKNVLPEDRVELPEETIAAAWGRKAE